MNLVKLWLNHYMSPGLGVETSPTFRNYLFRLITNTFTLTKTLNYVGYNSEKMVGDPYPGYTYGAPVFHGDQ